MEDNKKLEQGFDNPTRQVMKREVEHFTVAPEQHSLSEVKVSKNDNAYGVTWANLVKKYLTTAYLENTPQAEVEAWGVTYKVLRREKITVFYDADGNTLFDVENERLKKEYAWITGSSALQKEDEEIGEPVTAMGIVISTTEREAFEKATEEVDDMIPMGKVSIKDIVTGNIPAPTEEEIVAAVRENNKSFHEKAKEKLEKELKDAKDKSFAEPIIEYLLKRCAEDIGLAEDVCQKHKTWEKCFSFIYESARKSANGKRQCAVRNDVVYEWAEDYYHKDDKAEEKKKAKESVEKKKKIQTKPVKSFEDSATKNGEEEVKVKTAEKPVVKKTAEVPRPKKNSKEIDGQMDIFSLLGM